MENHSDKRHPQQRIPFHAYVAKDVMARSTSYTDRPRDGATCTVFMSNVYVDETFDRSKTEYFKIGDDIRDLTLVVGEGDCELDRGLDAALRDMSLGEESMITLRQNADTSKEIVVFVKLISCENLPLTHELSTAQKLKIATRHKECGNALITSGRVADAFHRFSKAIRYVIPVRCYCEKYFDGGAVKKCWACDSSNSSDQTEGCAVETNKLYVALCGNMALCHIRYRNYQLALDLCNKVLTESADNVKSLLRRMDCFVGLKDFENARNDCVRVLDLNPTNAYAHKRLPLIEKELRGQQARYVKMVKQMFKAADV